MRGLKICLWITGIFCLAAVPGVFAPMSAWQCVTSIFGVESLPDAPVFVYVARLLSATYGAIGVFFILLALRPEKYGVIVPFSAVASVLLGAVCLITGIVAGMPAEWFLGDSLPCIVLGVLIFVFWRQAKSAAPNSGG